MVMCSKKEKKIPEPVTYDFPDPGDYEADMDCEFDPFTCLHKAAVSEKWAERARRCGREDLAGLYALAAEKWYSLYKEIDRGE